MSDRPCNHCIMKRYKEGAKAKGELIKKLPGTWGLGGWEIFQVPRTISLSDIRGWEGPSKKLPNGDESWEENNIGWMMEIPEFCAC